VSELLRRLLVEREELVEEVRNLKDTLRVSQTLLLLFPTAFPTSLSHCIPSLSLGHCRDGHRGGHFKTTHKSIPITLMWIAFSLLYPVLYYVRYFRLHTAYHWLMYTSSYTMFADGGGQQ
jgi:hypothetical protein